MRIVVLSDSHGNVYNVMKAIKAQPQADVFIHLGDGALRDIDLNNSLLKDKMLISIAGNCDFASLLPYEQSRCFDNVKIFMTHGHKYFVKNNLSFLEEKSRAEKCEIALYGHTHTAKIGYSNGLYMMNPGTVGGANYEVASYGTIDITKAGIVCNIINLFENKK